MKIITLPEVFGKKEQIVGGRTFKDGRIIVSDEDAQKLSNKFVNFYGCTVETAPEVDTDENEEEQEPSLSVDQTKDA